MTTQEFLDVVEGQLSLNRPEIAALWIQAKQAIALERIAAQLENLTELNTHPGFDALEGIASSLKTIQSWGLTVEKRGY